MEAAAPGPVVQLVPVGAAENRRPEAVDAPRAVVPSVRLGQQVRYDDVVSIPQPR